MVRAITPAQSKTESKGVASVRQRVTNLTEHTNWSKDAVQQHLIQALCDEERMLTDKEIEAIEEIEATYLTDDFLWGKNPASNLIYEGRVNGVGGFTVRFRMRMGKIDGLTLEGDFFVLQDPLPLLVKCLCGQPIQEDAFRKALADVDLGEYIYKLSTEDWIQLIFCKPD